MDILIPIRFNRCLPGSLHSVFTPSRLVDEVVTNEDDVVLGVVQLDQGDGIAQGLKGVGDGGDGRAVKAVPGGWERGRCGGKGVDGWVEGGGRWARERGAGGAISHVAHAFPPAQPTPPDARRTRARARPPARPAHTARRGWGTCAQAPPPACPPAQPTSPCPTNPTTPLPPPPPPPASRTGPSPGCTGLQR